MQDALRRVVREAMGQVADLGFPGEHHFYITFLSHHPGVGLSEGLRAQFPEEMTIVLQHDYRDLEVDDEGFDVTLRFGGVPQSLRIPFEAVTAFFDPSVQFMLRFEAEENDEEVDLVAPVDRPTRIPTEVLRQADASSAPLRPRPVDSAKDPVGDLKDDGEEAEDGGKPAGEVVSFEAFRRK